MRTRPLRALALLGAALLCAGLGSCNFGRNVSDDCWIDRSAHESAERFRAGLRARNLPPSDGAWALAGARIERSRKALRACEDGARAMGRPNVADLSSGDSPGHPSGSAQAGGE